MKNYKLSTFLSVCRSDKVSLHSYSDVYDKVSDNVEILNMVEIGILNGSSINAFGLFFESASVYGVDVNQSRIENCPITRSNISLIRGDGTSEKLFNDHFRNIKFDLIIDDGSHKPAHQKRSFEILKSYLQPDGCYIIEDVDETSLEDHLFCSQFIKYDGRSISGRFDDVLLIYTKNKKLLKSLGDIYGNLVDFGMIEK